MDQDLWMVPKPMHGVVANGHNSNEAARLQRGHSQAGLWTILGAVTSHMVRRDKHFLGETTLEC